MKLPLPPHFACYLAALAVGSFTIGRSLNSVAAEDSIPQLLSDRCNLCHGPDPSSREAGLRLDTQEGLYGEANSGAAPQIVTPGKPAESELFRRITSDDPYERMPPPDSNLALSPAEIKAIRSWIEAGAEWEEHWALTPIAKPDVPATTPAMTEANNAVDRFLNRAIHDEGLTPTARADRNTLLRRLSLDLTGLPPTVEDIEAFVADQRPDAYQRLVDHFLASPAYGERMAVPWLDAARYADTYGYQADVYRETWPWRDWVIDAFNRGLPYDQFLTHQIAGDLLEEPTRESILATGFNRNHRQTNEGGSIEEEFRAEYVADRVNTLGTAVLGLTLECARCHDHKYDPISQRDYYQLFAFFNNIDESGLYSHFTNAVPTPTLWLPSESQQQALAEARRQIAAAEERRAAVLADAPERFKAWLEGGSQKTGDFPDAVAHYTFDTIEGNRVVNEIEGKAPGTLQGAKCEPADRPLEGGSEIENKALQLSGEDRFSTSVGGDWTRDDAFTIAAWIKVPKTYERAVIWHRSRAWTDAGSRGYELLIEQGRLSAGIIHFYPGNALRVRSKEPLEVGAWTHVVMRYDGSSSADGLTLFVNGQPAQAEVVRDQLTRTINGGGAKSLDIGARFRDRGFQGGSLDAWQLFRRDLSDLEIAALVEPDQPQAAFTQAAEAVQANRDAEDLVDQHPRLFQLYVSAYDPPARKAAQQLREARKRRSQIVAGIREVMVMEEMPERRETFLLQRGQYDAPGEAVQPETPSALPPMRPEWPRNRLGLAKWLVDPQHPLTARVAVNRIWQQFMGTGFVATAEDFGRQGQSPSHPELLDFLAAELMARDWDVKQIARMIVTSAAYQRSAKTGMSDRVADPENRFLARGPARRLSVEMIRDSGLVAAGLLDRTLGGPPVKPYQPPGLWKEKSGKVYKREPGSGSHRRSLYTIWKRTSPPPSMLIFDAPDREVCVAKRQLTQTPLQALVLLNDDQAIESARGCATRVLNRFPPRSKTANDADQDDAQRNLHRLDQLCLRLLGRPMHDWEQPIMLELLHDQQAAFATDKEAATSYLAIGDQPATPELDPQQLAAWTATAQAIMNYAPAVWSP